jgi:hypothetical protein
MPHAASFAVRERAGKTSVRVRSCGSLEAVVNTMGFGEQETPPRPVTLPRLYFR